MRTFYTWAAIALIILGSTAGDTLIAKAMQRTGDLHELWEKIGLLGVVRRVLSSGMFLAGVACLSVGFFSLLVALSWADVSLVVPASASLTFVTNAVAAGIFLHERVDRRRWLAAAFVAAGVALLAR